ncbi:MAG: DUF2062 domain-containing protein [Neisseriaceae bacterium]|nr:MAG: DUF2062 domain-containing protein [Neisseriaceae bacterium]
MKSFSYYISKVKSKIPRQEELFNSKWLRPFEPYFNKSYYWSFHRKNVAMAVAVGMFCGLMPGPTQMLSAFLLAYLLRANISVAFFTTLYTNPLTYLPLYYLAYKIGVWVIDGGQSINHLLSIQVISDWSFHELMDWFSNNLSYFVVGVPILGISLALISYYSILYLWKFCIISKRKSIVQQRQKY